MAQRERDRQMTAEEIRDVAEAADELGGRMVEALAEDLGGDPDDYRKRPVADGGE